MPEPTNTTEQEPIQTPQPEQVIEAPSSTPVETTPAPTTEPETPPAESVEVAPEPSQALDDTSNITFDSFKALKDGAEPFKGIEKKEAGQTKPTQQVQVKPEGAPTKVKEGQQQKAPKVARDFTGFDESEAKLLGSMSNDSFATFKPQLLERKNLGKILADKDKLIADLKAGKQPLPDNYFEHPSAFVLSPEYNNAAVEANLADYVQKHWQSQLVNIRSGKDWISLEGFGANNVPIKSQPQKATAEAEAAVMSYITASANQLSQKNSVLMNVMNGFKTRHEAAVAKIEKVKRETYSFLDDDKNSGHGIYKNLLKQIPPEFGASPLADILARSGATNILQGQIITAKDSELVKLRAEIAELKKNGAGSKQSTPTESNISSAGASRGVVAKESGPGTNFDDFKALKY